MGHQRGFSLPGFLLWGGLLVLTAVIAMKVAPSVIEYYNIQKSCKIVVAQAGSDATVAEIRKAFARRAEVDQIGLPPDQLEIYRDGERVVIAFAYERRVHLFRNVSLLIDYKGSAGSAGQQ